MSVSPSSKYEAEGPGEDEGATADFGTIVDVGNKKVRNRPRDVLHSGTAHRQSFARAPPVLPDANGNLPFPLFLICIVCAEGKGWQQVHNRSEDSGDAVVGPVYNGPPFFHGRRDTGKRAHLSPLVRVRIVSQRVGFAGQVGDFW